MVSLAAVAELADAHGSGPCPLYEGGGSTPSGGTQDGKPRRQKTGDSQQGTTGDSQQGTTGDSQQGTVAGPLFLWALPGPFKLATFDKKIEKPWVGFQLHVLDRLDKAFQLVAPTL